MKIEEWGLVEKKNGKTEGGCGCIKSEKKTEKQKKLLKKL